MLHNQVIDAYNFLLKTRNELHIHEGMHSDLLKYNVQKSIAASLGYKGSDGQNVRNFMRDYYLNARKIYRFNTILKEQIIDLLRTIPSLTIFMIPGGSILLPILLKILPEEILVPSSFRNK